MSTDNDRLDRAAGSMRDTYAHLLAIEACLTKLKRERDTAHGRQVEFIEATGLSVDEHTGESLDDLAEQAIVRASASAREVESLTKALEAERETVRTLKMALNQEMSATQRVQRKLFAAGQELEAKRSQVETLQRALAEAMPAPESARPVGEAVADDGWPQLYLCWHPDHNHGGLHAVQADSHEQAAKSFAATSGVHWHLVCTKIHG